jgi:hypothetical protein
MKWFDENASRLVLILGLACLLAGAFAVGSM